MGRGDPQAAFSGSARKRRGAGCPSEPQHSSAGCQANALILSQGKDWHWWWGTAGMGSSSCPILVLLAAEAERTAPQVSSPAPCLPAAPSPSICFSPLRHSRTNRSCTNGVGFSPRGISCCMRHSWSCGVHTPPKWKQGEIPEGKWSDEVRVEAEGSLPQMTVLSDFPCLSNPSCPPLSLLPKVSSLPSPLWKP